MTVRGTPAPALYVPDRYWEDRARRFAGEGAGLGSSHCVTCAKGSNAIVTPIPRQE